MHTHTYFIKHDIESALLERGAHSSDWQSGGFVRKDVIKAEYEADYL